MISNKTIVLITIISYAALHILMIAIFLSFIIKYYIGFSEYEYIWFCSKILTIKKIIRNNNKKDKIFFYIDNNNYQYDYILNYLDILKSVSNEECPYNYLKCGILDTYGNNFCVPNDIGCPVNDVIIDSSSKSSYYEHNNYARYNILNTNELFIYYRVGVQNKGVITKWISSNSQPKYINGNNFVLDMDAFNEIFDIFNTNNEDDDDDDDYDDDDDNDIGSNLANAFIEGSLNSLSNLIADTSKLEKYYKLLDYINDKINNDEKNIDYNYTYINYNNYIKNYMGFKDYQNAKDFELIDFSIYKQRYPNYISMIFAAILLACFTIITIIFIISLLKGKEMGRCFFIVSFIFYISSFLGFWIYSIVIYVKYFKNESIDLAKRIRADKFIEDFLKEFYEYFENKSFIISMITLLSFSTLLYIFIIAFNCIVSIIVKRKNEEYIINNIIKRQNLNKNINTNRPQLNTETIQINSNRQLNGNINQNKNNENNKENDTKNDILNINNQKIDNNTKDKNINDMNIKTIEENN